MGITGRTPLSERLIGDPVDGVRGALRPDAAMRPPIRTTRIQTRTVLVALAATLAVLAAGVHGAAAAPAASVAPTNRCWLDVVNDWLDHHGQIQGTYAIPCYTQAIQHLNLYPDVRQYSNATDDIQRALLAAIRQNRGNGPGASSGGPTSPGGFPSSSGGGGKPRGGGKPSGAGIIRSLSDHLGPGNAQSIPLPLLVLGILALLLLAAAGATWLTRRLQARRVTPAPAPAPVVPKRR